MCLIFRQDKPFSYKFDAIGLHRRWHEVCAAFALKRCSLCPHCAKCYRLPSTSTATLFKAPTATGVHRTQWGKTSKQTSKKIFFKKKASEHNLNSVHHHSNLHHLTRELIFHLVGVSIHRITLRDRGTGMPRRQTHPPQSNGDTARATCRAAWGDALFSTHNTLTLRVGVAQRGHCSHAL